MIKPKHIPIRTCVACRSTDAKRGLMRVVRLTDGTVCYDPKGKMSGRGAYVCARSECIQMARKQKKLERSLKVSAVPESVFAGLEAQIGDPSEEAAAVPVTPAASEPLRNRLKQEGVRETCDSISAESARVPAIPVAERVERSGMEPQESEG